MSKKLYLWLELLTIFMLVPGAYFLKFVPLPKIPVMLVFFAVCLTYLLNAPEYDRKELFEGLGKSRGEFKAILIRSLGVCFCSIVSVLLIDPSLFLSFPRSNPVVWMLVMILYPLLSAYPQELIYRAYFFHRYKQIIPGETAMVWASTILFSFLHIIFDNWLAVVFTIPAGFVFSRTYLKTGSLLMAAVEHSLYGCIIFTSGLDKYFYNH